MKTTATYETITPEKAKDWMDNSILKHVPLDYDRVDRAALQIEWMAKGKLDKNNSNLFMIMEKGVPNEPNTGENVLQAIIETNKAAPVAIIRELPMSKMVIVNPESDGIQKFEFWPKEVRNLVDKAKKKHNQMFIDEKLREQHVKLFTCFSTSFSWDLHCDARVIYQHKKELEKIACGIPLTTFFICYRYARCWNKEVQDALNRWLKGYRPGIPILDELYDDNHQVFEQKKTLSKQEWSKLQKSKTNRFLDFFLKMDTPGGIFTEVKDEDIEKGSIEDLVRQNSRASVQVAI